MACGNLAFAPVNGRHVFDRASQGFISSLLRPDPSKRASFAAMKVHELFADIDFVTLPESIAHWAFVI